VGDAVGVAGRIVVRGGVGPGGVLSAVEDGRVGDAVVALAVLPAGEDVGADCEAAPT
jgi:hypothetical protein